MTVPAPQEDQPSCQVDLDTALDAHFAGADEWRWDLEAELRYDIVHSHEPSRHSELLATLATRHAAVVSSLTPKEAALKAKLAEESYQRRQKAQATGHTALQGV